MIEIKIKSAIPNNGIPHKYNTQAINKMKTYLTIIIALTALAASASAMKADRGAFEGVTAEDIRSGAVSSQELQAKAESEAKSRAESRVQYAVSTDTASWNFSKRGSGSFSSLGENYIQLGAGADFVTASGTTKTGVDARLGLNVNLYKEKSNSGFGIDLCVPLEYTYVDISEGAAVPMIGSASIGSVDQFSFPAYLRPYYAIEISSDFVIKPFAQVGVGGRYSYMDYSFDVGIMHGDASMDGLAFTWAVGGGVEFCIFKDFYIQGKYLYNDSSAEDTSIDYYITPEHEISAEIGYRFTKNFALVVQYSHVFWKNKELIGGNLDQDKVGACLRFMF